MKCDALHYTLNYAHTDTSTFTGDEAIGHASRMNLSNGHFVGHTREKRERQMQDYKKSNRENQEKKDRETERKVMSDQFH